MDEQKETITSYDPQTGESKDVTLVLDHAGPNGMKLSVKDGQDKTKKNR